MEAVAAVGGGKHPLVRPDEDVGSVEPDPGDIAATRRSRAVLGRAEGIAAVGGEIEATVVGHDHPRRAFRIRRQPPGASTGGIARKRGPVNASVRAFVWSVAVVVVVQTVEDRGFGRELHVREITALDLREGKDGPGRSQVGGVEHLPHVAGDVGLIALVRAEARAEERSAAADPAWRPDGGLGESSPRGKQERRKKRQTGQQDGRRPSACHG